MFGIPQSLSLLVPLVIYFCVDLAIIAKRDKRRRDSSGLDLSLYNFITVIIPLLITLQPVLFPRLSLRISTWWFIAIQVFGLVLSYAGFAFLIWSRLHFVKNMNPAADGQYYAEYTEVQEDHPVVTSGPYALIRHPVYTSFFIIAFGVVLIKNDYQTVQLFPGGTHSR
jgi:protein-S-isoprenylcysteine O-methyltransferase Ste14